MGLTVKQENFCQKYVETSSSSESYRYAYNAEKMLDRTVHKKAYDVLVHGQVAARIAELQALNQKIHHITVDTLTDKLQRAYAIAEEDLNPNAMVNAVLGMAKLHGLLRDKVDVYQHTVEKVLLELDGLTKDLPNKKTLQLN